VSDPIQEALARARTKLDDLVNQRSKIDREIIDWKRVVDSLSAVSEEPSDQVPADVRLFADPTLAPLLNLKFTDAIRNVLASVDDYISAPAIRDQLIDLGFNFSKYKQELVPIHNTLKRLEEQGEAQAVKNEQGQTLGYKWISPIERALNEQQHIPNIFAQRMRSLGEPAGAPIDPDKLPEPLRGVMHPVDKLKAPKPPLTPGEARRMMETLRPQERFNLKHTKGK
jgi:hypothetical protein